MFRPYFSQALRINVTGKPKLYGDIYDSAEITTASYVLDLMFSAGIATLGLVLNSPAVVIGAMLISPLMGPILAAGLAFAASDVYLGVKAFVGLIGSILAAVGFSAFLVWLLPFQSPTAEILARTQPNLLDLGVAVFSGLAGSIIVARSMGGGAAGALPGVAIAVALMPPLCAVGFGVGSGWNWPIISGASLLFLTNLVAIAGSAFLIFYLVGMDAADARASVSESERRHAAGDRLYGVLHDTKIGRFLGDVGQLRWRMVMVAITVSVLFIPLQSSLSQLRDETLTRGAAREAVRSLVPSDQVLSQQLDIFSDRLTQRIVTTSAVDKERLTAAEKELARRTGKTATIEVRQVANEDELTFLRERLSAPVSAPPPPPPSLRTIAPSVLPLIDEPLHAVWPSETATLVNYEIRFSPEGIGVHLQYEAAKALDEASQEILRNSLRRVLDVGELNADFEWKGPTKKVPTLRRK